MLGTKKSMNQDRFEFVPVIANNIPLFVSRRMMSTNNAFRDIQSLDWGDPQTQKKFIPKPDGCLPDAR